MIPAWIWCVNCTWYNLILPSSIGTWMYNFYSPIWFEKWKKIKISIKNENWQTYSWVTLKLTNKTQLNLYPQKTKKNIVYVGETPYSCFYHHKRIIYWEDITWNIVYPTGDEFEILQEKNILDYFINKLSIRFWWAHARRRWICIDITTKETW
jgi:hypothetical protein